MHSVETQEAGGNFLKQVWYESPKTPGRGISFKRYHSPITTRTPKSPSKESSFKE